MVADADVLANAEAAYTEIRAQIDHQVRSADSIDTKAWGLVTVTGVVAGLVASRLHLDDAVRAVSTFVVLAVVLALLACCFAAIRPKVIFSYGRKPAALVEQLQAYDRVAIALSIAESMVKSKERNDAALEYKAYWYQWGIVAFGGFLAGLMLLVYVQAIR